MIYTQSLEYEKICLYFEDKRRILAKRVTAIFFESSCFDSDKTGWFYYKKLLEKNMERAFKNFFLSHSSAVCCNVRENRQI